jgi:hypothetical protein
MARESEPESANRDGRSALLRPLPPGLWTKSCTFADLV